MSSPTRRDLLGAGAGLLATASVPVAAGRREDDPLPGRTPHTRFAVNVEMWWRDLPLPDRIRAAAALGFPAIEFWNWRGKDLAAIAELTGELDLAVAQFTGWGFEPGLNDPANHAAFLEAVAEACEVAAQLRCEKLTIVAGNDQPGMTRAEMHEHVRAGLAAAAPLCEAAGVMLILEPMNIRVDHAGHCLYGSPDAVAICRAIDSPAVKLNWDLYHMQISEGDLCGHLRDGFDQVGYLQLADHPGRREPGTGEIHYARVLKEAHDLGYRGTVGLECWPTDPMQAARAVARADAW